MPYTSYTDLAHEHLEGLDYQRNWRRSPVSTLLHLAIHGGGIEQGTGELAEAAASGIHDLYVFDGMKASGNAELHITSTAFDEPNALALARAATHTVSWHGCAGTAPLTNLGGLDYPLRDRVGLALSQAGFVVQLASPELDGGAPENICNQNTRKAGVQLEISTAQRAAFFVGGDLSRGNRGNRTAAFQAYVGAVQSALAEALVAVGRG
ncbi:poly-gamma-glutamate hydrolase family protein (plasmid) [Streptomyces sp. NA02950]|uniref:poly-gamma-glutamate hydrolase family protein n=1 Tax=Streptomyces sp. NA02950 TaxID=2742137 RepID=UPI0015908E40|nr:poly-gamma-glutamate hydrolase family protein [Streptomyces sp. NA02950]QKV98243.1 poly-gamma-glutamate hydrolase family protein [Streptomyces sp. NA02950]